MTDELVSYRDERLSMAHHEFIHCRCPAGHQLKQTDTQWSETADSDVMLTTKVCTKVSENIICGVWKRGCTSHCYMIFRI